MTTDNQQLNHVISNLTQDQMNLEAKLSEMKALNAMKDLSIAKLEKDVEDMESQNDTLDAQNEELKEKIVSLTTSIDMLMLEGK